MTVAVLRTSDWETPLFLHVLGAMLLVGGLFAVAILMTAAWRAEGSTAVALTRFAYRTLFVVVLPAFIAMRIGAQWALDKSPFDEDDTWIGIGYLISDLGFLALVVMLVLAGIGLRREPGGTPARIVTVVTLLFLAAYVLAIWAMTTKPT
jgi:hypothetical protein